MLAVRRGGALRTVARRFHVRLQTVHYWVAKVGDARLDRVDWSDQPRGPRQATNRTSPLVEDRVLKVRKFLREKSDLGEAGPQAIRAEMLRRKWRNVPSPRTIARILGRRGALDGKSRQRRPPPPRGWFLSEVHSRQMELDSFDIIEDLVIEGGSDVNVLTGISLHGGLCVAWPRPQITAKFTVEALVAHWREWGLPAFVKFDNDTVFQGAHQHPDSFGRVTRMCLSLGVTPVFAPPRETGFQADIEAFNGRWQKSVWRRFHFRSWRQVQTKSQKYVEAARKKSAPRIHDAPARRVFPADWKLNLQRPLQGQVIYLRRSDEHGDVTVLGRKYTASRDWCSRLVRIEVDLTREEIRLYALRRREPTNHRFLGSHRYVAPTKPFHE